MGFKYRFLALFLTISSALCATTFGPDVVMIEDQDYEAEVCQSKLPVVVDFYADWCPPCRNMKPIFSQLATQYLGRVKFVAMNVNASRSLRLKYHLKGIPTFFFVKEGKVIEEQFGSLPKKEFSEKVESLEKA